MSERGVYRLAAAMLVQAIQDAVSPSRGRRASALRWMNSNQGSGMSFSFVCQVVNRDPDEIRSFCQERAAKRESPTELLRSWWKQRDEAAQEAVEPPAVSQDSHPPLRSESAAESAA